MTRGSLAAAAYLERATAMHADADRLRRKQQRLGLARLVVFGLIVLVVAAAIAYPARRTEWLVVVVIVVFSFARLLAASRRVGAARAWALTVAAVNEQSAARVERQWDGVPLPAIASPTSDDDPLQGRLGHFRPALARAPVAAAVAGARSSAHASVAHDAGVVRRDRGSATIGSRAHCAARAW